MAHGDPARRTRDDDQLGEAWAWLVAAADARDQTPFVLHSARRFDSVPRHRRDTVGAQAFSKAFETYLDAQSLNDMQRVSSQWRAPRNKSREGPSLSNTLKRLYSPGGPQSYEYRILQLVIAGSYRDVSEVRALCGCSSDYFKGAALRAIDYLRELVGDEAVPAA